MNPRVRLRSCRRACTTIQTISASAAGGQTHPNVSSVPSLGAKTRRPAPASVRTPAGTNAHRCGWPVHRAEPAASRAQPAANPSNAVPLMTCSCAPPNGPTTRTTAAKESEDYGGGHNRTDPEPAGILVMVGARNPTVRAITAPACISGDNSLKDPWWLAWDRHQAVPGAARLLTAIRQKRALVHT